MTTNAVATIITEGLWPGLVVLYDELGYEVGDGVTLSADGFDPPTHRGLHGYDFTNWEETFRNEAIVTPERGGLDTGVRTTVDDKTLTDRTAANVSTILAAQETWSFGRERPFQGSELFEALADDLGLIIIGTVDPPPRG